MMNATSWRKIARVAQLSKKDLRGYSPAVVDPNKKGCIKWNESKEEATVESLVYSCMRNVRECHWEKKNTKPHTKTILLTPHHWPQNKKRPVMVRGSPQKYYIPSGTNVQAGQNLTFSEELLKGFSSHNNKASDRGETLQANPR